MIAVQFRWLFLLGVLVACTPLGNSAANSSNANTHSLSPGKANGEGAEGSISCTLAYRNDPALPIQQKQDVRLSTQNQTQMVRFNDLAWQAQYWPISSPEGGSLKLSVIQMTRATEEGEQALLQQQELSAQLYQFDNPDVLQIQFSGGHGFTGLHYAYSSSGEGELQYWCSLSGTSPQEQKK